MIYTETKPCCICGEYYPPHKLNEIFTGLKRLVCDKCMKQGIKQLGGRRNKYIEKASKE